MFRYELSPVLILRHYRCSSPENVIVIAQSPPAVSAARGSRAIPEKIRACVLTDHDSSDKYIFQWKVYVSEDLTI